MTPRLRKNRSRESDSTIPPTVARVTITSSRSVLVLRSSNEPHHIQSPLPNACSCRAFTAADDILLSHFKHCIPRNMAPFARVNVRYSTLHALNAANATLPSPQNRDTHYARGAAGFPLGFLTYSKYVPQLSPDLEHTERAARWTKSWSAFGTYS